MQRTVPEVPRFNNTGVVNFMRNGVPYVVRLRRTDGSVLNLPDTFPDPTPSPEAEVAVNVDGAIVRAKVEKHSRWHTLSPEIGLQPVDMVTATQIAHSSSNQEN
jgi:hypothetical protein